ncbi:MAG: hypothetical protein LYZ66_04585, partial [Nitrososphaerales archaeon]|nr:hypothetical protein [Nitrososphaerales archaeon]
MTVISPLRVREQYGRQGVASTDPWGREPGAREKVPVTVMVDSELRVKMIRLGVRPTRVAVKAWENAVRERERALELRVLQAKDPRMTL